MASNADQILIDIRTQVAGGADVKTLSGLVNQLASDLKATGQATEAQRQQLVAARASLQSLAAGYAAGSAEARKLTQAAASLTAQIGRIDSVNIRSLAGYLAGVDTNAAGAKTRLEGIVSAAQAAAGKFAAGSVEAQRLAQIIADAQRSINLINGRGIEDLEKKLKGAGTAGAQSRTQLEAVRAAALLMAQGFAAGSAEAQRLAAIIAGADAGLKRLTDAEKNTGLAAQIAARALAMLRGEADSSAGGFSRLQASIVSVNSGLGILQQVTQGVQRIVSGGLGLVRLAGDMEQAQTAFTTMLGSGEKAKTFLAELADFAARTPFELVGLRDSSRRLLAYGFQAKDIIPVLTAVGNAVGSLGGGKDMLDGVTLAIGQIYAKGKVQAQEMNQLAERGIPAWKLLADKIGVSIPEAMKMAENGSISAATALPAILEGLQKRFGGGMEAQSKTLLGMWSNTTDVLKILGGEAGEYITEKLGLKDLLAQVNVNLGKIKMAFEGGGNVIGKLAEQFPLLSKVIQTVNNVMKFARDNAGALAGGLVGALLPGVFALTGGLVAGLIPALWALLAPIAPFIAAGAAIGFVLQKMGVSFDDVKTALSLVAGWLTTLLSQLASGNWEGAADTFSEMWNRIGEWGGKVLEGLSKSLEGVWDAVKRVSLNAFNRAKEIGLNIRDGIVAGTADLAAKLGESVSNAIEKVKGYIPDWARDLLHIGKGNFVDDTVTRAKQNAADARGRQDERNAPTYGPSQNDMPQNRPQTVQGREQLVSLLGLGGARTGTPFGGTYFGGKIHNGEDLFAKTGQDVLAPFTGYLTTRWSKTTGHIAELIDAAGNKLLLGHLDKYADGIETAIKKAGGKLLVQQGQLIAQVGQTGSLAHKDLGPGNAHIHAMGYRAGSDKAVEPFDIRYTGVTTPDSASPAPRAASPASKAKPENFDYSGVGGKAPVATLQDTLTARLKQAEDTFTLNTKGLEKSSAGYQKAVDKYLATLNNVQSLAFNAAGKLPEADASRSDLAGIVKSTADKISGLAKSGGAVAALKKQIEDAKGVFSLYTKETPGYDKALDAYLAVLRKAATESKKLGDGLPVGEKKSAFGALFSSTQGEIDSLSKKDGLADRFKRQLEDARAAFQLVSEDAPGYEKAVQTYIAALGKVQAAAKQAIPGTKDRTQKNALSDLVASTRSEIDGLRQAGTDADKIAEIVRQKSEARAQSEANTAKQGLATAQRSYALALQAAGESADAKLKVQKNEGAALEAAQETQARREYDLAKVQASNTLAVALDAAAKGKPVLRAAAEQLARQQNTLALQSAQDARDNAVSSAQDTQAQLLTQAEKAQKTSADAQLRLTLELQASLRGVKKEALTQQLSDAVTQRDADLKNAEGNLTEQLRIEQASGAKILAYQRQLAEVQRNEASRALAEKARVQKLSNATTYAGNSTGLTAANTAVDSATAAGKTNLQTAYLASLDGFGRVAAQRLKDVSAKIQAQENQVADQLLADRAGQIKTISDTVNGLFSGGGTIDQQAAGRSDALSLLAGALRGLLGVTADQASMGELTDLPTLLTKLAAAGVDLSGVDFDSLGQLGTLFQNLTINSDQFLPVDQAKQFAAALRDLGGAAADVQLGLGDKKLSPTILSAYTALSSGDQASLQAVNTELAKIDHPSLEALGVKVRAAIVKGTQEGVGLTIDGQKGVVQQQLTQLDQNKDGLSAETYLSRRKALLEQSEALDYAAEQQRLDAAGASYQAYENAEVAHLRRLRGLNDDYNAASLKADLDAARAHQQALADLELQALEGRHSRLEINEEDYINQRATRQLALAQTAKENSISDAGGLYGDPAKVQAAQDAFNTSQLRITGEQQAALGQLTLSRAKQTQDSLAGLEGASLAQRKSARLITEEEASRETERLQIDAIDREEKRAKAAADKAGDVGAYNEAGRVADAARIQATAQGEAERQNIVLQRRQATEDALSRLEQAGVDQRHALKLTDDLTYSQQKEDIQLASIERQHQAALTAAGVDVDLQNAADRDAEAQRVALISQGETEREQIRLQRRQSTEDALSKLEESAVERRHTLGLSSDLEYSQEKETLQLAAIERQHQRALLAAGVDIDLQNAADREAEAASTQLTTQGEEERRVIRLNLRRAAEDAVTALSTAQEEARYKAGTVSEAAHLTASLTARRLAAQLAYGRALEDAKDNADKIKAADLALQTALIQIDSDGAQAQIDLADKAAAAKVKAAQRDVGKGQGYSFGANSELQGALIEQISQYRTQLVGGALDNDKYRATVEALEGAEDALRAARGEQINVFGRYADLLANVTGALGNLAGAMGESEQDYDRFGKKLNTPWKDLAANIKGAENLFSKVSSMAGDVAKIVASGGADLNSWVSLAVKLGSGIADAIGGFKKAHAEVAKLRDDFKDANPYLNPDDYQKTSIRSKGWLADLFGGGPEVVNEVDKVGLKTASTFVNSVYSGMDGGFKKYRESGNIKDFAKALSGSIGDGVQQALADAFKNNPDTIGTYARDTKRLTDALALPDSDPSKTEALSSAIAQLGYDAKMTTEAAKEYVKTMDAVDKAAGTGRYSPEAIAAKQRSVQGAGINNIETTLKIQNRAKLISDAELQDRLHVNTLARIENDRQSALAADNLTEQDRLNINEEFNLKRQGADQDYLDWQTEATRKAAGVQRGIKLQALSDGDSLADAEHSLALAAASTDDQKRSIDSAYNADKLARTLERIALEEEAELSAADLTAAQIASIHGKYDAQERVARLSAQTAEVQAAQQLAQQREQTAQSWRQSMMSGVQAFLNGDSPLDAMYKGVRDKISQAIQDGFIVKRILSKLDPLFTQLDSALSKGLDAGGLIQQIGAALPGLSVQIGSELGPLLGVLNSAIPDLTKAVNNNTAAVKEISYTQTTIVSYGSPPTSGNLRAKLAGYT